MKAKFIEKYYDVDRNPVLVYEYRNCRYEVIDYGWKAGCNSLGWQHKNEQAHIDEFLDNPKPHDEAFRPEPASVGFDLFWEYVNG